VQVTRATFIPLLAPGSSDRIDPGAVRDDFCADLTVAYTFGPQFGRRVVTHADLDQLQLPLPMLRRTAFEHLEVLSSRAEFHGQPPALMLSFEGLESSLLLATDFWSRLEGAVPGELVVGVPARDVVIVTGSQSGAGMEKVRRCVERVFFAGGDHPLSRHLMVRRGGAWEPFDRPARTGGRPGFGPAHQLGHGQPPRQYQEHQSWPSQQVRPVSSPVADQRRGPARPPVPQPMRPAAAAGLPGRAPQPGRPGPSTGFQPVVRSGPPARADQRPSVADVAQYSAMPYSAMPHSAVPHSAMPHSVMPQSAMPYSAMPYSAVPGSGSGGSVSGGSVSGGSGHAPSPRLRSVPAPAPAYDDPSYGRAVPKPRYADDGYSTGTHPRYTDTGTHPRYTDDRYADASHSTGTHPRYSDDRYSTGTQPRYADDDYSTGTQPRYSDHGSAGYQAEQPVPEYPASWGWAPEQSASRPEWRSSPRARFSSR
jgi:hypothetical protein